MFCPVNSKTYHIIGDGIAGLMLAWQFHLRAVPFIVYASLEKKTASAVAGGLMNPITGMRFVKTWLADELFPFAWKTYHDIEQQSGVSFIQPINIFRTAENIALLNDLQARAQSDAFKNYVFDMPIERELLEKIPHAVGGMGIRGAGKIETTLLLNALRKFFEANGNLAWRDVNENAFSQDDTVIFCEGKYVAKNAVFSAIPVALVKGHYLVCDIPDLNIDFVLQGKASIIPQPDGLYRIGSTYQWKFDNEEIEETQVAQLTQMLRETINLPFEVKDILVGIRPASPDRRPILGSLKSTPNRYIFNGLGTKGFSLAPYFASVLCEHILAKKTLPKEVDVKRFKKL